MFLKPALPLSLSNESIKHEELSVRMEKLNSHCKIFASAASSILSEVGRHEHFPSHHLDPSTDDVSILRQI